MKNKMKRFVCAVMAVLMPITVVGCAKETNEKPAEANSQISAVMYDDSETTSTAAEEETEEKTEKTTKESKREAAKEEHSSTAENETKRVPEDMEAQRAKAPDTNVFFGDRKAYYEFNNSELNGIIDQIKSLNYTTDFKVEDYINKEIKAVKNAGFPESIFNFSLC